MLPVIDKNVLESVRLLPHASRLLAALVGFIIADIFLVWPAGLAPVRRFFLRHGLAITRLVGVMFVAFGAKSLIDAGRGFASRA